MARVKSSLVTGLQTAMGTDEFVVVELTAKGPMPVYDAHGQLMKFSTGEAASAKARAMTVSGKKFQPRRVKDDTWRTREEGRFEAKEYKQLPWHGAVWWQAHKHIWGDHFPHVSQKNSVGLMAFTENEDKGSADLQTPVKPGKYLEKYFASILDPYIIRDLCTTFSNVFEDNCLIFADTEDEFESLYVSGPGSCMSHPKDKYTSHIHPVRVYAAGDLALVYMKRDGRVVARTLCWPDKKIYSRVYGDAGRIEPLLKKEGFVSGTPFGARLQRVLTWENKKEKTGNMAFVAPHIDNCSILYDEGDHLIIGGGEVKGKKRIALTGASGVTEWVSVRCHCGKETTKSGLKQVYVNRDARHEQWCDDCVAAKTFKCTQTGHYVSNDSAVIMHDGSKMWDRIFRDGNGFTCAKTGLNHPREDRREIRDTNGKSILVSKQYLRDAKPAHCKTCSAQVVAGGCEQACQDRYNKQQEKYKKMTEAANQTAGAAGLYQSISNTDSQQWYTTQAQVNPWPDQQEVAPRRPR